jgi:hypothetical protein
VTAVRELIVQNILTTLKLINGAGIYDTNVENRVYRFSAPIQHIQRAPYILVSEPVTEDYESLGNAPDRWHTVQRYAILGVVHGSIFPGAGEKHLGEKISDLLSDMIKALMQDRRRGTNAGTPNAIQTLLISSATGVNQEDTPTGFVELEIEVWFRFSEKDPEDPPGG